MGPSPDDLTLLAARRARIMERMGGGVMLLAAAPERPRTADILYPYRQDSDFAYVTGFPEPEAVCVLTPDAKERFVLFVRPRDPERELWVGTRAGVEGAVERYGADAAFKLEELERELPRFFEKAPQVWHTVRRDDALAQRLMALIRRAQEMQPRTGTGPTTIREPGDLLHEMRLRKEPAELAHARGDRDRVRRAPRGDAQRAPRHVRVRDRGAHRLHLPPARGDRPGLPVHRGLGRERHRAPLHRQ